MKEFLAKQELAKLKVQTRTIRKTSYRKSRLDKHRGELKALLNEGAKLAELHRWLRSKRVKVAYSTVVRWVQKNG
ncbi:hypothetical protein JQC92_07130 [Shewanella sp. 202IG2-18]|uniref:hypothetical protein n=1 Tax=Parashewanella hymeniacidonis TaxID=2807618 RepID=UPI0019604DD1|nr:hypothetical protein [Parashewanella hymeniacidonis]MBM7071816.1 hypothetical protein [Parashewanella hymeniacidonis]